MLLFCLLHTRPKQAGKPSQRIGVWLDTQYRVGTPCYAVYCGPRREKDPRWVSAVVTKVGGAGSVCVRVYPKRPIWQRNVEQLRTRCVSAEDVKPDEIPTSSVKRRDHSNGGAEKASPQMKDKETSSTETDRLKGNVETLGSHLVTSMAWIGCEGLDA